MSTVVGQRVTKPLAGPTPGRAVSRERSFGLSVGGVCALLALGFLWRERMVATTVASVVAAVLGVLALGWPALLRHPSVLWWRFSHLLGWINTRALLSVFFMVVLAPAGMLMGLAGWDPLRRRPGRESGWVTYSPRQRNPKHYERMY